ncbi:glycosyltransferase [Lunatibacter salilacus]|uniref:glycosyltransferase n=1 Tax=Lunatibacter salilacus TaxID=2483804 RepID=UPI00131CA65F|nr:glycosyltransferase [Lunatibacter salilacus]
MRILQINSVANSGSTGRIAEEIGNVLMAHGHESFIAYGRGDRPSQSNLIKIGNKVDTYFHGIKTAVFDRHGFGSKEATHKLILEIEKIKPDAIGLHNLHGYYLNIEILFDYLKSSKTPVLWTLFDCWAFTGHCTYFDNIQCEKWKEHCEICPKTKFYPSSYVLDNSFKNFEDKNRLFSSPANMELLVHSQWLKTLVEQSFLSNRKIHLTPSGIDLEQFSPSLSLLKEKYSILDIKVILGCASIWDKRKGLDDFIQLHSHLTNKYKIVLIGLNKDQIAKLPDGMLGITRTESIQELAEWYSLADVFVNPTYQDNFPTTNLEALGCGTPVITYNTGGSPEAIDEFTGLVVPKGDIQGLKDAVEKISSKGKAHFQKACRIRAEKYFNKNDRYLDYLHLYESLVNR